MKATIFIGDAIERLRELSDESVQCVVTSPPYWGLRDYQTAGQLGLKRRRKSTLRAWSKCSARCGGCCAGMAYCFLT